ncbi:unnamed protein product [Bursaphelenchus okinawaensis]|uniref:RING-type domain-containing protein n=1 Tax=Bursaphelenchus okinawaensis TaxID=465554 RepID=A0A811KCE5_9BILA|nr:unnamed protein product [Bursaphelenchus okinawaensis]CAG9099430.1 unnamed protein product [Bursaphelenchus okinawaensis]
MKSVKELMEEERRDEEEWHKKHEQEHIKHRGHDVMHAEIFIIFILVMAVSQIILVVWKRKHFRSYQVCTLLGLWLIPPILSIAKEFYRFLFTWVVFSAISGYIFKLSTADHISGKTPRFVYNFLMALHVMSYVLGIFGYAIILGALFGVNFMIGVKTSTFMDLGLLLMFYGIYYGVLGRDFAHICTDRMACKIGYFTNEGLPKKTLDPNVCAVCGDIVRPAPKERELSDELEEPTYTLTCGHRFHERCIRGWVVIGKLQTCPYCKEKVDLQRMFKNPWEKPHLFYGKLLDWCRYLVAWQPLILFIVKVLNNYFGLE